MKPFDERFTDHMREVFDRYEEPVDARAFDQFRSELKAHHASGSALWKYWAAAAVLVLSTGLFAWQYMGSSIGSDETHLSATTESTVPGPGGIRQLPLGVDTLNTEESAAASSGPKAGEQPGIAASRSDSEQGLARDNGTTDASASDGRGASESLTASLQDVPQAQARVTDAESRSDHQTGDQTAQSDVPSIAALQDVGRSDLVSADSLATEASIRPDKTNQIAAFRDETVNGSNGIGALRDVQPDPVIRVADRTSESDPFRRRGFDIVAGSMINYTDNRFAPGVGFQAGATHTWEITRAVSLSTGGLLAYNQFEYDSEGSVSRGFFETLSDASRSGMQSSENVVINRQVTMLALEVPLNAVVELGQTRRNQYAFSVGLSSLVYLNQQFDETGIRYSGESYASGSGTGVQIVTEQFQFSEDLPPLQRFDAGRLLNLSFMYGFPVRDNRVALEAYMKYPLREMTNREIRMGQAGVSLRYHLRR